MNRHDEPTIPVVTSSSIPPAPSRPAAVAASMLRAPAAYAAAGRARSRSPSSAAAAAAPAPRRRPCPPTGPTKLVAVADAFEDNAKTAAREPQERRARRQGRRPRRPRLPRLRRLQEGASTPAPTSSSSPRRPASARCTSRRRSRRASTCSWRSRSPSTRPASARCSRPPKKAKEKNLKVGVGLQRHHDPKYIETVKRIQDGAIGDIVLLRVYWNDAGVVGPPAQARARPRWSTRCATGTTSTGCAATTSTSSTSTTSTSPTGSRTATPSSAQGQGGRQVRTGIDHGEIFDHHFVEFTYADGTKMLSQCRHQPGCWNSVSEHAHGTKGYADISGGRITTPSGEATGGASGSGGEPLPGRARRPVRRDPQQQAAQRGRERRQQHDDRDHGPHGDLHRPGDLLGPRRRPEGRQGRRAQRAGLAGRLSCPSSFAWDAKPPTMPDANGRYPIPMPGQTVGKVV